MLKGNETWVNVNDIRNLKVIKNATEFNKQ